MRVLIIGCGYLGSVLGQKLTEQGYPVIGVTRSEKSARGLDALGIESRIANCSTFEGAQLACRDGAETVVFCVSSRPPFRDYQQTYVEGMRCTLHALEKQPPRLFIHVGSASVYAQTTGEWVTEASPAEPPHENGRFLLKTEQLLAHAARGRFKAYSLRLSGIYGPTRHALLDQLREGVKTLPGDGSHWMNQIYRNDIVEAMIFLMKLGIRNTKHVILNLSDDTPVLQRDYVEWCCRQIGRTSPVFMPDETASSGRERKGFRSNRRICNQALKSLGWTPRYPSYREGLLSESGGMEISP